MSMGEQGARLAFWASGDDSSSWVIPPLRSRLRVAGPSPPSSFSRLGRPRCPLPLVLQFPPTPWSRQVLRILLVSAGKASYRG